MTTTGRSGVKIASRTATPYPCGSCSTTRAPCSRAISGVRSEEAVDADDLGAPAGDLVDVGEDGSDRFFLVVRPHHDAHVVEGVLRVVGPCGRIVSLLGRIDIDGVVGGRLVAGRRE